MEQIIEEYGISIVMIIVGGSVIAALRLVMEIVVGG